MKDFKVEELPVFVLLKNLVMEDGYSEDSVISSFEWYKTSKNLKELQAMIPRPKFPKAEEKLDLLYVKFGDVLPEDKDDYYFDDAPAQLDDDISDIEIFGESYTILWVCPADKEKIIAAILEHLKKVTDNYKRDVDENNLFDVWSNYLERMWIYARDKETFAVQVVSEIKEELPELIARLPNAPDDHTWDEFENMLI
jgi:hypothetical protein